MNKITSYELSTALDELRQSLGQDFQLDEDGSCLLLYKNELPILIQYIEQDGRLFFSSEFRSGLEKASDSEWLKLLSLDWLGIQSRGCAFSPDVADGVIHIWRDAKLDQVTGHDLEEAIADFVSEVIAARKVADSEPVAETSTDSIPFLNKA